MKKLLMILTLTGVLFSDDGWLELPSSSLPELKVENYSMRDDIDYVELRQVLHSSKTDKPVSDKYIPYFTIERKSLSAYSPKVIKDFRRLKFQKTKLATIARFYASPRYHYYKVNGFIIKKDGSYLVFNEDVDIGWIFNGIDTLAELIAYTGITNTFAITQRKINGKYKYSLIYRKTKNGYEIKHLYDKGISNSKEKLTQYHTYDVHLYSITKEGKITQKKTEPLVEEKALSKDFFKVREGAVAEAVFHPDPVWAFHSEKEMVEMELNDEDMVTP